MNVFKELIITFTIGFLLSFCFGILFERARIQRIKKKAGYKNQPNKIPTEKLYQIEGGRSMLAVGDIVHATDDFYGSYIGKVINIRTTPVNTVQVQIIACISYPKQYAQFFRDKPIERYPYKYNSIHNFAIDSIGKYVGKIPEYNRSVQNALNNALKNCRPIELPILLKHSRKIGDYLCVG